MEFIQTEQAGHVLVARLAHGKANTLTTPVLTELNGLMRQVADDQSVRALVLASDVPGFFSAGFDIGQVFRYDAEEMRTFYITGFDDGCPRQLTAAHVLLGAPSFYELLHYGPAGEHLAQGETDAAYERVKREVCGARKGRPCGAQIKRLERSTFFVNAYPRADDNTGWSEMLIHKGTVMATAQKSSG